MKISNFVTKFCNAKCVLEYQLLIVFEGSMLLYQICDVLSHLINHPGTIADLVPVLNSITWKILFMQRGWSSLKHKDSINTGAFITSDMLSCSVTFMRCTQCLNNKILISTSLCVKLTVCKCKQKNKVIYSWVFCSLKTKFD